MKSRSIKHQIQSYRVSRIFAVIAAAFPLVPLPVYAQPEHVPAVTDLPVITVSSKSEPLTVGEPEDIQGHNNYVVTRSDTGSKTEQPNRWVPQSVITVPEMVIRQQGNTSVSSALENVSGVTNIRPSYYPLDQWSDAYIRGFRTSMTLYDGLWDPTPFGNSWMGNVERVEVLKGPAGLLYGAYSGDIGGIINVRTKQPKKDFYAEATAETDSYGSTGLVADLSTPISNDKTWLLRIVGNVGKYKSFYKNSDTDKRNIQVSLEGLATDSDRLKFTYEYRWQKAFPYSGQPGYGVIGSGDSAHLVSFGSFKDDLNLFDPRSYWEYESNTGRATWEHRFNDRWSFRSHSQVTETSRDVFSISADPSFVNGSPLYTQYAQNIRMGPVRAYDTDNMINGRFAALGMDHDLVVGARYAVIKYDMNMARPTPYQFRNYRFTDPDSPNWGQPAGNVSQYMYGHSDTRQSNFYINDTLSLTDRLRIVGGANYVDYTTKSSSGMNPARLSQSRTSGNGFAWRVGMLYDITSNVTPYVSYSTTFKPQGTNTTDDGTIQSFSPLKGEQIEGGVKFDIDNKASITAAIYQITLSNVTQADPDPVRGTLGYEVQTGKQRSRGFELDGTYRLQPGWNMLFSYAYTDASYVRDDTYEVGSGVPNVPRHAVRLWSTYDIQEGPLQGFGFGAGIRAVSSRQAALVNKATPQLSATLPGYATFDAMAYYAYRNMKITLNLYNLFDRDYTAGSNGYAWLYPGEPFHAALRLQASF
ncbi:MAG: TonB-dependent receptor [Corticimicrobacter sp.]|uniref:TonB-dependent siderophore receptor n=1 Tax=Corticimicrobacter sp. TaxID=2678536 RepID=UPI0032DAA41E